MAFDFSTLVTDRTQQDVAYAKALLNKLVDGTATEAERAEWNSFTLKGTYNHTDLNRVTAAMEALKAKLEGYGYSVPGYQRIKVPHNPPPVPSANRLPEGYLELTYIESTGTQYIDTKFSPNQDTRVVCKAQYTNISGSFCLFGARYSVSERRYDFLVTGSRFYSEYNNNSGSYPTLPATTDVLEIDKNKNVTTVNGVTHSSHNYVAFQTPCNMLLFAENTNNSPHLQAKAKIYSFQIYDNGTMVRDYVPCINPSGDVGLFDVVNKQFYGNAGTGAFVAGGRVGVVLPDGYTRLSHIESTGTQYIDTGFKPNQDSRIDMVAQLTGTVGENNMLFGTRSSGTTEFFVYYHTAGNYYGRYVSSTLQVSKTFGSKVSVSLNKNTFTLDGSSVSTTYSAFQCTTNAVLFAWNNTGTISDKSAMKLYSCQIYDNGTLIRDYVPCINSDGEVGLYDLVAAAFLGNSGTGAFVAGAIPRELPEGYTQVEYIQSSGTQYINTGFKPNNNTRVVMDAQMASASTAHFYFGARNTRETINYDLLWTNGSIRSDYGESKLTFDGVDSTSRLVIDKNKNVCNVNGVSVTNTASTFQLGYSLYLFASHDYGSAKYHGTVKVYSCKIYDNGTLIRDYVPCKNSGGVFGLYDLANDVFYQNAGSGTFAAGEEVVAPATASVMVASSDLNEYDPYTWYEFDWPTPESMTIYLLNVSAIRSVLVVLRSTPEVPTDMERLMAQEANNIEAILLDVCLQLSIMPTTFIPCGEALCGGDNL